MEILVYVLFGLGFGGALWWWSERNARAKLEAWATEFNYELVSARWVPRWNSPFPEIASDSIQQRQTYRFTVRTAEGAVRSGWISLLHEDHDVGLNPAHLNLPDQEVIWD